MSRSCLVLLAAMLWSACEQSQLPPPSILNVEPAWLAAGQGVELRVRINALLPGTMDYAEQSVMGDSPLSQVQVWVGAVQVPVQRYEAGGILVVLVPATLAVGAHDVRLVLSDGREALQAQALTVRARSEADVPGSGPQPEAVPDGGSPPDAGVPLPDAGAVEPLDPAGGSARSFRFDTVEEQVRDVPFTVVLRAEGPGAASFQGMVRLSVNKGTITPAVAGPFVDGVATVRVTLDASWPNFVITAEDDQGHQGSSNEFRVRPN